MSLKLAIFDFDYTIINANSTKYLNKLIIEADDKQKLKQTPSIAELNRFKYPSEIENNKDDQNSTKLYQAIFNYMHSKYGIKKSQIEKCLKEISINDSMKQLFKKLNENGYELIIVSDSYTFIIETIIKQNNLMKYFENRIYANKASFSEDGCLLITPCIQHFNNGFITNECFSLTCKKNICKRSIIESFIKRKKANYEVDNMIYVGDGKIDYCPGVGLRENDIFFVKNNSALFKFLNEGYNKNIKAKIKYWKNANDILEHLEFKN